MGTPEEGEQFLAERWPEARAVSDEGKQLYAAFGLSRGSLRQVLGLNVMKAGLRSLLSGHGVGRPVGDPMQMSGWFLVRPNPSGGEVVWSDVHSNSGVERDFPGLLAAWRG